MPRPACIVCGRPSHCRSLCGSHYAQMLAGKPFTDITVRRPRVSNPVLSGRRKECTGCGVVKVLSEVHYRISKKSPSGFLAICKRCEKSADLTRRYGISIDEYEKMKKSQDYKCAICKTPDPGYGRDWRVDHDHDTGAVRGLLCGKCNSALGYLEDSVEILESATQYLRNSKEK